MPADDKLKKVSTTVYLEQRQIDELQQASSTSKIPMAEFIRHGVDLALKEFWENNFRVVPPGSNPPGGEA
jgi:hypothetical protein